MVIHIFIFTFFAAYVVYVFFVFLTVGYGLYIYWDEYKHFTGDAVVKPLHPFACSLAFRDNLRPLLVRQRAAVS